MLSHVLPLVLTAAGHFAGTRNVPRHVHDGLELVYVSAGHCACEAGQNSVEGIAGDILVLPDAVAHNQITLEPTQTSYVAVRGFEGILDDRPRVIAATDERLLHWLDDLIASFDGTAPLSVECQSALALALLQALSDAEATSARYHPAVVAAMDCMRRRLADASLCLPELARAAGASVSHLSLLFRTELRCSPMQMLTRLRMDRARQMLAAPYARVNGVAAACGYKDASYFSRTFRRHAKVSPACFRRGSTG